MCCIFRLSRCEQGGGDIRTATVIQVKYGDSITTREPHCRSFSRTESKDVADVVDMEKKKSPTELDTRSLSIAWEDTHQLRHVIPIDSRANATRASTAGDALELIALLQVKSSCLFHLLWIPFVLFCCFPFMDSWCRSWMMPVTLAGWRLVRRRRRRPKKM